MLSTIGTLKAACTQNYANIIQYPLWIPDADIAALIQESIGMVKSGNLSTAGALMDTVVQSLRGNKDFPIMAACTEIPFSVSCGRPSHRRIWCPVLML